MNDTYSSIGNDIIKQSYTVVLQQ